MSEIKISIITASYNNFNTLEKTIQSVIEQTYKNIEFIIIDGLSTDGTSKILEEYENQVNRIIIEKDDGMYHALNKGIKLATGDVIGFLHADDFYASPGIIEKVAHAFEEKKCDAVYGDLQYVYKNNEDRILRNWISGEYHLKKMKKGWMPPHPTLFIKKDFYYLYGLFDTSFKVAADYELMTRFLCCHRMNPVYIPEVFIKMRWGGKSNKNITNILLKMYDDYRAIRKNGVGNIFTLLNKNLSKVSQFASKNDKHEQK